MKLISYKSNYCIIFLPIVFSIISQSHAQKIYPTIGKIVSYDPAFDALVPKDAKIEVLASGFSWSEGPVWVKDGGYLLFSDVPENTVYKWSEKEGLVSFLRPSGYTGFGKYSNEPGSNGLTINQKGELVSCEHGDRRVSIMALKNTGKRTLADNFEGKKMNSPNDVVQHSSGAYYFTDPPYGLPTQQDTDPWKEQKLNGVYQITTDGKVKMVISDLTRPNGLAFSPNEKYLYVGQSDPDKPYLMSYPVNVEGILGIGKILFDTKILNKEGLFGGFDGLKVDKLGNIYATGPKGVLVINSAGKLLGRIQTDQATANCCFGDDGKTLYITADAYLCRIKLSTTGVGF